MEKQLEALKNVVTRVWRNNAVSRGKMEAAGIYPDDIASLADFRKLPFTVKQDLRDSYPLGMCCASRDDVVRIHASSGTTGKPTIVPYTKGDLDVWSECMAECLATAGVTKGDVFQVILGYGLFTGALGFHYGAERLGATVVPTGGGFTERQLLLMEDMGTTAFTSTPSYALHLSEIVESRGLRDRLRLRLAILGGEAWTPEMGEVIERRLGVTAVNSYGLSEIMGPGVAMECPHKTGMHFNEDCFFMEVLGEDDEQLVRGLDRRRLALRRLAGVEGAADPALAALAEAFQLRGVDKQKLGAALYRLMEIEVPVRNGALYRDEGVAGSHVAAVALPAAGNSDVRPVIAASAQARSL